MATRRRTRAPRIVIVAGPNGAGKSTCAPELLRRVFRVRDFVNADEIQARLPPGRPGGAAVTAGRIMLREVRRRLRERKSFAVETTLAGRGHVRWIRGALADGFHVFVVFLALDSPGLAITRVARRVLAGGHGIPEPVIRRRFARGLANFFDVYGPLATSWRLYDNACAGAPRPIAMRGPSGGLRVVDPEGWTMYVTLARA